MEIYLIRHTTPKIEKGICYGQTDIPVRDSFYDEAESVLQHLPDSFDMVYTSPLSRCSKLAQLIQPTRSVVTDKRLLEMNFGDWEMKKWDEINQEDLHKWTQDFVNVTVPNGENFIQLNTRVNLFMHDLAKQNFNKVAVVTHAGIIRSFVISVLGIPEENAFRITINYGSITKINIGSDRSYNNVAFLNKQ
jgi:alpha-ribazole phosphatase